MTDGVRNATTWSTALSVLLIAAGGDSHGRTYGRRPGNHRLGRVAYDEVPDKLGAAIRDTSFLHERPRRGRGVDLEAIRTGDGGREPDVVEDGADRDDFEVTVDVFSSPQSSPRTATIAWRD